jgi:hypothetical protein
MMMMMMMMMIKTPRAQRHSLDEKVLKVERYLELGGKSLVFLSSL